MPSTHTTIFRPYLSLFDENEGRKLTRFSPNFRTAPFFGLYGLPSSGDPRTRTLPFVVEAFGLRLQSRTSPVLMTVTRPTSSPLRCRMFVGFSSLFPLALFFFGLGNETRRQGADHFFLLIFFEGGLGIRRIFFCARTFLPLVQCFLSLSFVLSALSTP